MHIIRQTMHIHNTLYRIYTKEILRTGLSLTWKRKFVTKIKTHRMIIRVYSGTFVLFP